MIIYVGRLLDSDLNRLFLVELIFGVDFPFLSNNYSCAVRFAFDMFFNGGGHECLKQERERDNNIAC